MNTLYIFLIGTAVLYILLYKGGLPETEDKSGSKFQHKDLDIGPPY